MAQRQTPTPEELAELFQEHREGLAGAVRGILGGRAEVAEVLQDAYLKALKALHGGSCPDDPVAWIFVVVLNRSKDLRRKLVRRQPSLPLEDVMEISTAAPAPGTGLENQEAVAAARSAIERLRDAEKEVFLLRASAGLTFEAIGAALGIPTGTAKTRMRAALLRLRGHLAAFTPSVHQRKETA